MTKDFCGIINNVCDKVVCRDCFEFINWELTNKKEEKVMKDTTKVTKKKQVEAQLAATKVELVDFATYATELFGSMMLLEDKLNLARNHYRTNKSTITELENKLNLARDYYRLMQAERDAWKATALELAGKNQKALVAAKKKVFTKLPKAQQDRLNAAAKATRNGNATTTPATPTTPAARTAVPMGDWKDTTKSLVLTKEQEAAATPVDIPCGVCGEFNVKPNVANYSLRKFEGKVLCRTCQAAVKKTNKSAPAAPATPPAPAAAAAAAAIGDDIVF